MKKRIIVAVICSVFGMLSVVSAYANTIDNDSADAVVKVPQRFPYDYLWTFSITDENGASLRFYAFKTYDDYLNPEPLKDGDSAYFGNFDYYTDMQIGSKKITIPATVQYNSVELNVKGCGMGWIKEVEEIKIDAPIDVSKIMMPNLINYHVSADNPYTEDIDGVLFSKEDKALLVFPGGRIGTYVVPRETEIIGRPYNYDSDNANNTFGASKLNELVFEDGSNLKLIRNRPFDREFAINQHIIEANSPHIKRVILPESRNDITLDREVFYKSDIEYLYLSRSVKVLHEDCFKFQNYWPGYSQNLAGYATIEVASDNPASFITEGNIFNCPAAITLVVPDGCKEKYEQAEYWRDCGKIIEHTEYVGISNIYNKADIATDGKVLNVSNLAPSSKVEIYTLEGRVLTETRCSGNFSYTFNSAGIYIVRVNNMSQKIVVK